MPEINNENVKLQEIRELERQLAEKKASLEKEKRRVTTAEEAEITQENIQEKQAQGAIPQQQTVSAAREEDIEEIKKDIRKIRSLDTRRQVKVLVTLAFEKGIAYSIKVARSFNDAYLLDQFHDELIGKLHDELVRKGKLKEI